MRLPAHRRFSNGSMVVSFSDGAIQCMRPAAWYFKSFQPQIKMTTADGRMTQPPENFCLSPRGTSGQVRMRGIQLERTFFSTEGNEANEGRRILGTQQMIQLLTDKVSSDGPLQTSPSVSI